MGQRSVRRITHGEIDSVQRVDVPASDTAPRVAVGSVHDPAEAEADALAHRALALSHEYEQPGEVAATGAVHRSPSAEVDGLEVGADTLRRAASSGRPLAGDVRDRMERGFGTDLSDVRVHTGSQAADVSRQIHARAFTHGSDVYFGADEYRPGTPDGDRVLAHEIAHTVQSSGRTTGGEVHRFPATWLTSPVPWKPLTASVFRPGEGASGGVFILTSKDPDGGVSKVVAKPVYGENGLGLRESGQQLQFSDAALAKLLGLNAPGSKVVGSGTTEFGHLVDACISKQPPGDDLSKAESFVVMAEVPNATSVASLADKAGTDKRAGADLFRSVFDPVFLAELGRLCIGDLMLGNPDRMVLGAMNLGNVMLSMNDGKGTLAAIDTTTYLPRVISPQEVAKHGQSSGRHSLQSTIDRGPGDLLDGFFAVLVNRIKSGTPAESDAGAMSTWAVIESSYTTNRDSVLSSFEFGWNDAMITALMLSNDDDAIDSVTAGYDDQDIDATMLKSNLSYLGERAQGKDHKESVGRSIALTAAGWARSVNLQRTTPPASDELAARSLSVPTGKVLSAEVATMPSLPTGDNLKYLANGGRMSPLGEQDYPSLPRYAKKISRARTEADQDVGTTKRRRTKGFGKKQEMPRNRSLVSHYVVDSVAVSAGAARAADAAHTVKTIAMEAKYLLGGDYRGNEATPVASLLRRLAVAAPVLEYQLNEYKRELTPMSDVLPRTAHADGTGLATSITAIDTYLDKGLEAIDRVKKLDLQKAAAGLG